MTDEASTEIEALATQLQELKAERDLWSERVELKQKELLALLEDEGGKYTSDTMTVTKVQGTRAKWDEEVLQASLSKRKWESVTRRQLDTDLLEAQVKAGNIKLDEVQPALEVTENKPYVKVTLKKASK